LTILASNSVLATGKGWGIRVNKGCGSAYRTGERIVITYEVGKWSLVRVVEEWLNESVILFEGYRMPGTYVIRGTIGSVPGPRLFKLYEVEGGSLILRGSCNINVVRSGEVPLMVIIVLNITDSGVIAEALYSPLLIGWKEFVEEYFLKNKERYFKELKELLTTMLGVKGEYKTIKEGLWDFYDEEVAEERIEVIGVTLSFSFSKVSGLTLEEGVYELSFIDPLKRGRGWIDWVIVNAAKPVKIKEVKPLSNVDCFSAHRVAWYNPSYERAPDEYVIKFVIGTLP